MGGDDNVVLVGLGLHSVEEWPRIGQAKVLDKIGVCDKAVPPAHRIAQLATSLDEEQR